MRALFTGVAMAVAVGCLSPAAAQAPAAPAAPLSEADTRELLEAAKATAKATRESVEYARVTPDILHQILAKLDKLEDKLDKVEDAIKAQQRGRGR